jgi:hypothetical protein
MMLRIPDPIIPQALSGLSRAYTILKTLRNTSALNNAGKIEYGDRDRHRTRIEQD